MPCVSFSELRTPRPRKEILDTYAFNVVLMVDATHRTVAQPVK